MPTLTLDPEKHQYAVDGKPVHGVSKILHAAGLIDATWLSEEALKRGSIVHQTIEFYLTPEEGELNEDNLHPNVAGYLKAFKKAERELGLKVERDGRGQPFVEYKTLHPMLGYAGTIDYVGRRGGEEAVPIIVDIKSGSPDDWHPIQLAAYALTFTETRVLRANLYVQADGNYRWFERTDRKDFDLWKAALVIGGYRIEKGLAK